MTKPLDVIAQLDIVANYIVEAGDELPAFATIGVDAWNELCEQLNQRYRGQDPNFGGMMHIGAHLMAGTINIKPSPQVPADFVGIGRIGVYDIIIEDILLDGETYSDLDTDY